MAKTKRVKSKPLPVPENWDMADLMVHKVGNLIDLQQELETKAQQKIDQIKADLQSQVKPDAATSGRSSSTCATTAPGSLPA